MSELMKKVMPPEGQELKFMVEQEPWSVYRLENGGCLRVRLNIAKIIDTGKVQDDGTEILDMKIIQVVDYTPAKKA